MQIFVVRKRHLLFGLLAVLFFSALFAAWSGVTGFVTGNLQKVVVIDAGHGSIDSGACYNNLEEKTINLQIAFILKELLEERNIKVVMTRTDDSLYNRRRADDIVYRARKTNEVGADAFVSIHVNKFPTAEPFGGQAYYYSGQESKALAELIQKELKNIQPANYRSISRGDYYVLKKTNCPAVLVEVGFISNPSDRQRMTDPTEQRKIAGAIRDGVIAFFRDPVSPTMLTGVDSALECSTEISDLSEGYDLYFMETNPYGEVLIPVHKNLPSEKTVAVNNSNSLSHLESTARDAICDLIAGPKDKKLAPTIPKGTKLLSIRVNDGLAIVDFNQSFSANHWGSAKTEQATVESIVRTLTAFPDIDRVQILIEGQSSQTLAGHIIFDRPLTAEMFEQSYNW